MLSKCFQRKCWLGRYGATRNEWKDAWRLARIARSNGKDVPTDAKAIEWKAGLLLSSRRMPDGLLVNPKTNLMINKLLDDL